MRWRETIPRFDCVDAVVVLVLSHTAEFCVRAERRCAARWTRARIKQVASLYRVAGIGVCDRRASVAENRRAVRAQRRHTNESRVDAEARHDLCRPGSAGPGVSLAYGGVHHGRIA